MMEVFLCPECKGEVWNNTEENNNREANGEKLRPDYSCKDKEGCGWLMWREKGKKKVMVNSMMAGAIPTVSHPVSNVSKPVFNGDDKAKTMIMAYAKDLVVAIITAGLTPPDSTAEVISIYHKLMAEINK